MMKVIPERQESLSTLLQLFAPVLWMQLNGGTLLHIHSYQCAISEFAQWKRLQSVDHKSRDHLHSHLLCQLCLKSRTSGFLIAEERQSQVKDDLRTAFLLQVSHSLSKGVAQVHEDNGAIIFHIPN